MDKIYYGGKIYSIDADNHEYEAIGVENGRIAFLGTNEEAKELECKERINLDGKTMLPGLCDSHLHMLNYAFVNQSYNMQTAESIEEIIEKGKEIEAALPKDSDQWVYGRGWNETKFTSGEKRQLTRHDLDRISTERPILFIRVCGHYAAVNTKAMEIIMGLENTKDYLDQINPEQGGLTEASVKLCYNAMTEPTLEQLKEMILATQKDYNAAGITSVHTDNFLSLPGRNSRRIMQAYRELDAEGKLTVKVTEQASFTALKDLEEYVRDGNKTGNGTRYYRLGPVKLYQDGSLGAKTALMNDPYLGTTDVYGTMTHPEDELNQLVDVAYKNDNQILIHTIGDKAADMVMDAYERVIDKYGEKPVRLAINHLQVVSPDLFDRMKAHDILAYIQPVFVAGDKEIIGKLVGEEKSRLSYMWKTILDKGLVACGGSDSPVERFDILENIQIGVTRDALNENTEGWYPEQKISVLDAVKLFTINNAYGSFEEDEKGSLEIGKAADFAIMNQDIFFTDPHKIKDIKIMETVIDGNTVFKA